MADGFMSVAYQVQLNEAMEDILRSRNHSYGDTSTVKVSLFDPGKVDYDTAKANTAGFWKMEQLKDGLLPDQLAQDLRQEYISNRNNSKQGNDDLLPIDGAEFWRSIREADDNLLQRTAEGLYLRKGELVHRQP